MTEDYHRPPIVAIEPTDPRVLRWRFRAAVLVVLLAVAVAAFFIARAIITGGPGDAQAGPLLPATVTLLSRG